MSRTFSVFCLLLFWTGWVGGGSYMLYSGSAFVGPWKSGNCTVVKKSVEKDMCIIVVNYHNFYNGSSQGTMETVSSSDCATYQIGQGIPCAFSIMSPKLAFAARSVGFESLATAFIFGAFLVFVCAVCPIVLLCFKGCAIFLEACEEILYVGCPDCNSPCTRLPCCCSASNTIYIDSTPGGFERKHSYDIETGSEFTSVSPSSQSRGKPSEV